jgi:hypothetical protein
VQDVAVVEDQRPRPGGVSPLERKGQDAAERLTGHTRSIQTQLREESGETVGVAIQAERLGQVG